MILYINPVNYRGGIYARLTYRTCPVTGVFFRERPVKPAADYVESELDLNELCIRRRASTFFVRASGNSMQELGLCDGDVMVVDRAEEASHGDIVIAEVNGEFTVKRLQLHPRLALLPMNPAYSVIYPDELQLLGVVTWFFSSTKARRR
ncbi:translesion error-prone DNA polymerase V autoproteolytic subunit [Pantoea agglomerans]|uniref:translesion error-prone DNA polymerase V autoproteolytic subunit n=1 Tax=Enterobacter agglomerans TaxID=549 RepID=UPI003C7BAD13